MSFQILIVEDDQSIRELYPRALRRLEAELVIIDNGEAALDYLERNHVDLLLTDINLPGISGIHLMKHARLRLELEDLKIIAVSANYVAIRNPAIKQLANAVMEKPIQNKQLLETCKALLGIGEEDQILPRETI